MRTDHKFSHRNNFQMQVEDVAVLMNAVGTVTALIKREDGLSLQLYMSKAEADTLASMLAGASFTASAERHPRLRNHDTTLETKHGVARLEYLGNARYRVAGGAAFVSRHSGQGGPYWLVEGSRAKYPTRLAAVAHVMEHL